MSGCDMGLSCRIRLLPHGVLLAACGPCPVPDLTGSSVLRSTSPCGDFSAPPRRRGAATPARRRLSLIPQREGGNTIEYIGHEASPTDLFPASPSCSRRIVPCTVPTLTGCTEFGAGRRGRMLRGVLGRFVIFWGACGAHPSSMHPVGRACAPPRKSRLRAPLPLTAISQDIPVIDHGLTAPTVRLRSHD